jgi:hypothetical protein
MLKVMGWDVDDAITHDALHMLTSLTMMDVISRDGCLYVLTLEWLDGFSCNLLWRLYHWGLVQNCAFNFIKLVIP